MAAILQSLSLTSDGALGNFTTTSATMVDIHSSMNLSFFSNGGLWVFYLTARAHDLQAGTVPNAVQKSLFLDNSELNPRGGLGLVDDLFAALVHYRPIGVLWVQKVAKGDHTIKPRWAVDTGSTARIYNDSANNYLKLYAIELDF